MPPYHVWNIIQLLMVAQGTSPTVWTQPTSPTALPSPFHHSALDTLTSAFLLLQPTNALSTPGTLHGLFSFSNLMSPADSSSFKAQLISPLLRKPALSTRAEVTPLPVILYFILLPKVPFVMIVSICFLQESTDVCLSCSPPCPPRLEK